MFPPLSSSSTTHGVGGVQLNLKTWNSQQEAVHLLEEEPGGTLEEVRPGIPSTQFSVLEDGHSDNADFTGLCGEDS